MKQNRKIINIIIIAILLVFTACPAKTVESVHVVKKDIDSPSENELKAIYLYNFLQFVQWPKEKCNLPHGKSVQICVLGDSPFEPVLRILQKKLELKNQELQLNFFETYHEDLELPTCCLLFISSSEQKNLPKILNSIDDKAILTVTDSGTITPHGVMITLVSRKNTVRWTINREPVKKAGLRLSAKLLAIAVQVMD